MTPRPLLSVVTCVLLGGVIGALFALAI
jgi:hypothetical protein